MPQQLQMIWPEHSTRVPEHAIHDGYFVRPLQDGDESGHVRVMRAAGFSGWTEAQLERWRLNLALPDGIFVAVHEGSGDIVATALASHRPTDLHPSGGEFGWLAADPAHAGRGLGMAVSLAALRRFLEAGYHRIYLQTDDHRLAAIKTYLKMGFVPFLCAADMESRWRAVAEKLSWPITRDTFVRVPENLWAPEPADESSPLGSATVTPSDVETGALGILTERDVAVPMRDGITLRANIFRPDAQGRFPALVHRTPYSKAQGGFDDFVRAGYAVVTQDSRGRYASEGEYTVFTEEDTGDAEDGYDTVEWAARQPWCNGAVGTFGASYDAWMQYKLAGLRPPHLKAMSAVSIPTELTDVDWPGAFKPGRRINWWLTYMAPDLRRRAGMPPPHTPAEGAEIWNELEQGRMLALMPWSRVAEYLPSPLAEHVAAWLRNPARRAWRFTEVHKDIEVPNLDFTGWYDHCCSIDQLTGMQKNARSEVARKHTQVVIGPWNHCNLGKRNQAGFDFGLNAQVNVQQMQIRWFDHWLKGVDNGVPEDPAVRYFVMGDQRWQSAATWPPKGLGQMVFHLASNGDAHLPETSGALVPDSGDGPPDTYTHDPFDPVPTLWGKACFYNVSDRRRLDHRTDILRYRTAPLEEDIEVVGNPEVLLYAASSAPDADFFVRLVDEEPDGPAMEVCYGMVRARHRNSLEAEELLTPGEVTPFRIRMGIAACRFRRGHRIRIDVCSSDFPNHDRNHGTGGNDLMNSEMVTTKQSVYHSTQHPSSITLPVRGNVGP